jgi:hypothetical protein
MGRWENLVIIIAQTTNGEMIAPDCLPSSLIPTFAFLLCVTFSPVEVEQLKWLMMCFQVFLTSA